MMKKKLLIIVIMLVCSIVGCEDSSEQYKQFTNDTPKITETTSDNQPMQTLTSGITENGLIYGISQKDYHPIVVSIVNSDDDKLYGGIVLGGSADCKWFSINDFVLPEPNSTNYLEKYYIDLVKGGENFKMYSSTSYVTLVTGSVPDYSFIPSSATHTISVAFDEYISAKNNVLIGISCKWNALPRIPKKLSNSVGYAIDLDNDDLDEMIRIKKDDKNPQEIYYVLERKDLSSTVFANEYVDGIFNSWSEILFADLNGDGTIEIILVSEGHNTSINVFEFINGKVERVLEFYVGD